MASVAQNSRKCGENRRWEARRIWGKRVDESWERKERMVGALDLVSRSPSDTRFGGSKRAGNGIRGWKLRNNGKYFAIDEEAKKKFQE